MFPVPTAMPSMVSIMTQREEKDSWWVTGAPQWIDDR
jgi:hypothetical protein